MQTFAKVLNFGHGWHVCRLLLLVGFWFIYARIFLVCSVIDCTFTTVDYRLLEQSKQKHFPESETFQMCTGKLLYLISKTEDISKNQTELC